MAREVQPSLLVDQDAVQFVEELLYKILGILCAMKPRTMPEVEDYVTKTFDPQVGKWANKEAREVVESYIASKQKSRGSHGHAKPLNMPVDRVHGPLCKVIICPERCQTSTALLGGSWRRGVERCIRLHDVSLCGCVVLHFYHVRD